MVLYFLIFVVGALTLGIGFDSLFDSFRDLDLVAGLDH